MQDISTSLTPMQRFWQLLRPDSRDIYQVYTYAFFKGLIALSMPLGIQSIINLIQGGAISTSWILMSFVIALCVALNGYMQLMQMRLMENIQQRIFVRASFDLTFRIPRLRLADIRTKYTPELMNRFFEILSIQKNLSKIIINFSSAILQIIFGLILLSLYHPFFILFSAILVILIWVIIQFTSKAALETSLQESKFKYQVLSWLEELARVKETFKMAGTTTLPETRTDNRAEGYLKAREQHYDVLRVQYSLLLIFKVLVALALLLIGGSLVIKQKMNIGQFVAAEIIILLVIDSVEKIILSLDSVYDTMTSLEKISEITGMRLDEERGEEEYLPMPVEPSITLSLNNVSFSYVDSDKQILQKIDMQFDPGKKYGIKGDNGSGKSTLLHLIGGLFQPTSGSVCINGQPMHSYRMDERSDRIGTVFKEDSIFEGSILDNITLGRADMSMDQIQQTLDLLFLSDFIRTLPDGLFTKLEPLGRRLPRSIIQKILIARAVWFKPSVLLIENALENIVVEERKKIYDYLFDQNNQWTLIAVSNDPLVTERCDVLAEIQHGQINSLQKNEL
ncbi:MAG: peptidase domain-containing ABC transporter [Ferruginibacter sp.]